MMKIFKRAILTAMAAVAISACDGEGTLLTGLDGTGAAGGDSSPAATGNIVQTAVDAGSFTTLAAALGATGLDTVLADETREFTVFAPTDAAFAELGTDTINALLGWDTINALVADPDTLKNILLYHVIDGAVDAETAISLAGSQVHMANGDAANLTLKDGDLFINDSKVIVTDIQATNGVIHVIDTVLIPH